MGRDRHGGRAVLLKAAERVYGLVKAFAQCLADKRAAGKIRHTFADLGADGAAAPALRPTDWARSLRRSAPTPTSRPGRARGPGPSTS